MWLGQPLLRVHNPSGIEGRIRLLRRNVRKGILDPKYGPAMRHLALAVTRACPWRDDRCELEAIWYFMHRNIRYTGDLSGYDTFQTPIRTLEYRGGDCDDGSVLIASLAMFNGFMAKLRITKNAQGGSWAHIYPLIGFPKHNPRGFLPLDWTLGYSHFGAHPPQSAFVEFDGHQISYDREISPQSYMGW